MDITIGTLAKKARVHMQTLRYYERRGLLPPVRRGVSGYRFYNEESLKRLKFIRHAQAFGFSLEEIASLLKLKIHSPVDCRKAGRLAKKKVFQIHQKIESMKRNADYLDRLAEKCGSKKAGKACPLLTRFYGNGSEKS
jgi:DNA-binding transcriptional MerR regulator